MYGSQYDVSHYFNVGKVMYSQLDESLNPYSYACGFIRSLPNY